MLLPFLDEHPDYYLNNPEYDENSWIYQEFVCKLCGITGDDHLQQGRADWICDICGCCYGKIISDEAPKRYKDEVTGLPRSLSFHRAKKKDKNGNVIPGKISYGCQDRRYKPTFHYKERLEQWQCLEPTIPDPTVLPTFRAALATGRYGQPRDVTRGTVMQMCRELKRCDLSKPPEQWKSMCRYKENWKTILFYLRGEKPAYKDLPRGELLDYCKRKFKIISGSFLNCSGPLKGARGKNRHNICHINYTHRKILES